MKEKLQVGEIGGGKLLQMDAQMTLVNYNKVSFSFLIIYTPKPLYIIVNRMNHMIIVCNLFETALHVIATGVRDPYSSWLKLFFDNLHICCSYCCGAYLFTQGLCTWA